LFAVVEATPDQASIIDNGARVSGHLGHGERRVLELVVRTRLQTRSIVRSSSSSIPA
jgi:hypothetical protein